MSSIIKVGKLQSSTGQDAVTVADSGAITANGALTATGAITASGGIANAGTITAGTLGSSVIHSVGWQHIETISCPTDVDSVSFNNIFTDDYVCFDFEMAMEGAGSETSFYINFLDSSNNAISDSNYFSTLRMYPYNANNAVHAWHTASGEGRLIYHSYNSNDGGFRGRMVVRNVSAPTLDGVDTDRGGYRHEIIFTGSAYIDGKYSYITNHIRYNNTREENTTMGIKIFIRDTDNTSQARNFASGSWITCFGLKGKSTA